MLISMITSEMCDLLEVGKDGFKSIVRSGKLDYRLLSKGYVLINKYKSGRDNVYEIRPIEAVSWEMIQAKHGIRNPVIHTKYSVYRGSEEGMSVSRNQAIKKSEADISYPTAKKYDNILEMENIIKRSKEKYFIYDFKTKEFESEISKEEYQSYWVCNAELNRQVKSLRHRRNKYEISEVQYDILINLAYEQFSNTKDKIAIKFTTYEEMENTKEMIRQMKNDLSNRGVSSL